MPHRNRTTASLRAPRTTEGCAPALVGLGPWRSPPAGEARASEHSKTPPSAVGAGPGGATGGAATHRPQAPHARRAGSAPAGSADAERALVATVYKTPTCGCCAAWVDHLRANGFRVATVDREDLAPIKAEHGVGEHLASCHTALIGGYVVEGHGPAADITRLLRERPAVVGIAAPGMPSGSPDMEVPGAPVDRYDVVSFDRGGATQVCASH